MRKWRKFSSNLHNRSFCHMWYWNLRQELALHDEKNFWVVRGIHIKIGLIIPQIIQCQSATCHNLLCQTLPGQILLYYLKATANCRDTPFLRKIKFMELEKHLAENRDYIQNFSWKHLAYTRKIPKNFVLPLPPPKFFNARDVLSSPYERFDSKYYEILSVQSIASKNLKKNVDFEYLDEPNHLSK